MLTPEQLGKLREKIDERHEALESEIHRDAARSRDEPYGLLVGEATESGDNATADLISDLDNAELTRDLEELRALQTAQVKDRRRQLRVVPGLRRGNRIRKTARAAGGAALFRLRAGARAHLRPPLPLEALRCRNRHPI